MNWDDIKHFSPKEFPEDPDKYADPELILTLDRFRDILGRRVFPSPVAGALARFNGRTTTQHYVGPKEAPTRLSTGVDFFPEGFPILTFATLWRMRKVNGIGIYLDTKGIDGKPWVMFHLDIRKVGFSAHQPWIWFRVKITGESTYLRPQKDTEYWSLLRNEALYRERVFKN